jgi:hypothetical protein
MKQAAMIVLFFYLFVARVLGKGWYGALAVAIGQNGYHFHQITGNPGPTPYGQPPPHPEEVSRVVSDDEQSDAGSGRASDVGRQDRRHRSDPTCRQHSGGTGRTGTTGSTSKSTPPGLRWATLCPVTASHLSKPSASTRIHCADIRGDRRARRPAQRARLSDAERPHLNHLGGWYKGKT